MKGQKVSRPGETAARKSGKETTGAAKARSKAARPKLRTILVPTDFSKFSERALGHALLFAKQFESAIQLLHVVEPHIYPVDYFIVPPEMEDLTVAQVREARERLARLGNDLARTKGVKCETAVRTGRPYREIVDAAHEMEADLIVIATHGISGLQRFYLGSTAERVVRHAPCPVLVVRDREPK